MVILCQSDTVRLFGNLERINIWAYKKHSRCHTKDRREVSSEFHCDRGNCEKAFGRKIDLQRHLNLHDNNTEKCYFCPWHCASGSTQAVRVHLNHHYGYPEFECSYCEKLFYTNAHLKHHIELYHEKIEGKYKCPFCYFKTYAKNNLFAHIGRCPYRSARK